MLHGTSCGQGGWAQLIRWREYAGACLIQPDLFVGGPGVACRGVFGALWLATLRTGGQLKMAYVEASRALEAVLSRKAGLKTATLGDGVKGKVRGAEPARRLRFQAIRSPISGSAAHAVVRATARKRRTRWCARPSSTST